MATKFLFSLGIACKAERTHLFIGMARNSDFSDVADIVFDCSSKIHADGYCHLHSFVSRDITNSLLRQINAELGDGLSKEDAACLKVNRKGFGSSALLNGSELRSLLVQTKIWPTVVALFGVANIAIPSYYAQVALRFPQKDDVKQYLPWHVDNVREDTVHSFGLLVGVFLTDAQLEDSGNFTVFPGGHRQLEGLFRSQGASAIFRNENGRIVTPENMELSEPKQLLVQAGDVVIAHPLLPHRAAPNLSPNIRVAIYFRIYHPLLSYEHPSACPLRLFCLQNIWAIGWTGLGMVCKRSSELCDVDPSSICKCGTYLSHDCVPDPPTKDDLEVCEKNYASCKASAEICEFYLRTSFCSSSILFWKLSREFIWRGLPSCGAILDVGCASGFFLKCLEAYFPGSRIPFGIDRHWVVKFARKLFPEHSPNFLMISIEEFLNQRLKINDMKEHDSIPTIFSIKFDGIYWNFWDNLEIHEASLALVTGLIKCLTQPGVLVLGFYMPDAEANLFKAQSIVSALQQGELLKPGVGFSKFDFEIQFNPHRNSGIQHLALVLTNFR